jgi:hypothetical protein
MTSEIKAGNATNGVQITSDSTGILEIKTGTGAGTTAMVLNASQNVGIGTTSPRSLLDLNTTRSVKVYMGTAGTIGETQGSAGDYIANNLFVSAESGGTMTYTKTTGDSGNAIIQDFSRGITLYTGVTGAINTTGTLNNFERVRIDPTGNFQFNSGYGSVVTAFGCRAWVNFNGTGTVAIRASGNVTSITDGGTGNYTVNFTTAMPDANYGVNIQSTTSGAYTVAVLNGTYSTTAVQFVTSDFASTLRDPATICVSITR